MSYDRAITVFSPDGQLMQVQYAQEAVHRGSGVAGVRGASAVVLAAERRAVGALQAERAERKIVPLDEHLLIAFAGLKADARVLINRAQIECQSHRLAVEDAASAEHVTRYVAGLKQGYTQSNGKRPFGISCLIAGFDDDATPRLFQTEPSGIYYEWKASAIGRGDKAVREYLETHYNGAALGSAAACTKLAVAALLEVANSGKKNLDVAVMQYKTAPQFLSQNEIDKLVEEIEKERDEAAAEKDKKASA